VTWASPIPRGGKGCESVYDVKLRPGRVLDGEDDPSADVVDDGDERCASSLDLSRHQQGGDGQRTKGAWTSPARDQEKP
jgi:hypothetical protein